MLLSECKINPSPFKDKENRNSEMLSNFLKFTKLVEIWSRLPNSKIHAFFTVRYALGSHLSTKWKVKSLSRVRPSATPWTAAFQAPPSMGFSRQEYWSGVPLPSPPYAFSSVQFSRSVVSDSLRPHELQHARPPCPSPTHVHCRVSDAIQLSHPLSSPSPPSPNPSQHQSLFQWVSSSHEVAKVPSGIKKQSKYRLWYWWKEDSHECLFLA